MSSSHLARVETGGYIYALKFSNGFTKVGWTCDPMQRLSSHIRRMRRCGGRLSDWFFSSPHEFVRVSETFVIDAAEDLMTPASFRSGREWFYNIDYNELVERCRQLVPHTTPRDIPDDVA